ncbi:bifunctional transcriptional activator/DNA repair enzyme AdaA [Sneathiella sp.]|uniref:bifunctional transcriptional activator/DNA repair enzyme AdaA n=1 Tax=Sneathiella sp. TaxID=1964365 RepID=UPI0035674196
MDHDTKLTAIMRRDTAQDGLFVYAVKTTGIFCRPSCPSRNPKPENIVLYDVPEQAAAEGYRPCLRCRPDLVSVADPKISLTRQICGLIAQHFRDHSDEKLSVSWLAEQTGYSEDHLSRSFKKVLGVTPSVYYDNIRLAAFKKNVQAGESITSAAYGVGFGSSSRLYEKSRERLGMSPASYARGGAGAEIAYAFADCFLGQMLVAGTRQGVCAVYFGDDRDVLLGELHTEFPLAEVAPDVGRLQDWSRDIVKFLERSSRTLPDIPLDMYGTAFQRRVWQELLKIAPGATKTYREIAQDMGQPKSARAVGRACATNPVSLVVPCHRVIGSDGKLHGYRWGLDRKEVLRAWEETTAKQPL